MDMPSEAADILRMIHQDIFEYCSTPEEIASYAVQGLSREDAQTARAFIIAMASEKYSADELQAFWGNSPAEIYFANGDQVRSFLRLLLSKIDEKWPLLVP